MIVVHHLNNSRSQRILWLLEELQASYEVKNYQRDPRTGAAPIELKSLHPLGKLPVISDAGRVVAESGVIIDYILRKYGCGRLQADTAEGAFDDYIYWMHAAEGSAMPTLLIRLNIASVDPNAPILQKLDKEIANHFEFIEAALDGRDYLIGGGLTAADIQVSFFGELAAARFDIKNFPNMKGWIKRFQARPAYKAALERGGTYRLA
jgi:glutathione S-transferase